MAPQYKLTYFQTTGAAEPMRFLMKYGGIEFEDERIKFEQWSQIKANMPFGQLPVLTINGKIYNQSISMTRFLAKKVKLVGKDELEDMEIDSVVDTMVDLRTKFGLYAYEQDAALKEKRKEQLLTETIPFYLERLDKIAAQNNGYMACNKLTWADMQFAAMVESLGGYLEADLISKYPNLQVVKNNVFNIPAIKEWVKNRPANGV